LIRRAQEHGHVQANGIPLGHGNAAKPDGEASLTLYCGDGVEVQVFDLS